MVRVFEPIVYRKHIEPEKNFTYIEKINGSQNNIKSYKEHITEDQLWKDKLTLKSKEKH